jgi:hypothetical protein
MSSMRTALRLVIANKDRMHPGVMDGETINRRVRRGVHLLQRRGDEVGGLPPVSSGTDSAARTPD